MDEQKSELHRRIDDDTAMSIKELLKEADDREKREMLLVLQRMAENLKTNGDALQLNNQMTLNLSAELQKLSRQFMGFKEEHLEATAEKKGMLGVINKFARPIAVAIWGLTLAIGGWGFSKINDTAQIVSMHLAVSEAVANKKRDDAIKHQGEEMDKLNTSMAVMVEQHRKEPK